jgi:hypothetical protein
MSLRRKVGELVLRTGKFDARGAHKIGGFRKSPLCFMIQFAPAMRSRWLWILRGCFHGPVP